MTESGEDRRDERAGAQATEHQLPSYDTRALFGTKREVILVHKGEPYRLRQTQSGKLILTK